MKGPTAQCPPLPSLPLACGQERVAPNGEGRGDQIVSSRSVEILAYHPMDQKVSSDLAQPFSWRMFMDRKGAGLLGKEGIRPGACCCW